MTLSGTCISYLKTLLYSKAFWSSSGRVFLGRKLAWQILPVLGRCDVALLTFGLCSTMNLNAFDWSSARSTSLPCKHDFLRQLIAVCAPTADFGDMVLLFHPLLSNMDFLSRSSALVVSYSFFLRNSASNPPCWVGGFGSARSMTPLRLGAYRVLIAESKFRFCGDSMFLGRYWMYLNSGATAGFYDVFDLFWMVWYFWLDSLRYYEMIFDWSLPWTGV